MGDSELVHFELKSEVLVSLVKIAADMWVNKLGR